MVLRPREVIPSVGEIRVVEEVSRLAPYVRKEVLYPPVQLSVAELLYASRSDLQVRREFRLLSSLGP